MITEMRGCLLVFHGGSVATLRNNPNYCDLLLEWGFDSVVTCGNHRPAKLGMDGS